MAKPNAAPSRSADEVQAETKATSLPAETPQPAAPAENSSAASNLEIGTPFYAAEILPDRYRGREHYAARDACYDRDGVLRALRRALREANGRAVTIEIHIQ